MLYVVNSKEKTVCTWFVGNGPLSDFVGNSEVEYIQVVGAELNAIDPEIPFSRLSDGMKRFDQPWAQDIIAILGKPRMPQVQEIGAFFVESNESGELFVTQKETGVSVRITPAYGGGFIVNSQSALITPATDRMEICND